MRQGCQCGRGDDRHGCHCLMSCSEQYATWPQAHAVGQAEPSTTDHVNPAYGTQKAYVRGCVRGKWLGGIRRRVSGFHNARQQKHGPKNWACIGRTHEGDARCRIRKRLVRKLLDQLLQKSRHRFGGDQRYGIRVTKKLHAAWANETCHNPLVGCPGLTNNKRQNDDSVLQP